jgi:hypothetical protein
MCPVCIATMAIAVVGTGSAGGLGAVVVRHVRKKKKGMQNDGSSNRIP